MVKTMGMTKMAQGETERGEIQARMHQQRQDVGLSQVRQTARFVENHVIRGSKRKMSGAVCCFMVSFHTC